MPDTTIEKEIVIDAPVDVVWRTITEPDQIRQWFADRVELDARPGGAGTLIFEHDGGTPDHVAPLVVETVDPPTHFTFRWCHPDGEAPVPGNSMLVDFTLIPEGDARTRLRVTEVGLDALDWAEPERAQYVADHNEGWENFIGRIPELLAGRAAGRPAG